MHPIVCFKVLAGKRHQRAITRMIKRLEAGDSIRQVGTILRHVVLELRLGVGGTSYQNCASVRKRRDDVLKEFLVYPMVSAAH